MYHTEAAAVDGTAACARLAPLPSARRDMPDARLIARIATGDLRTQEARALRAAQRVTRGGVERSCAVMCCPYGLPTGATAGEAEIEMLWGHLQAKASLALFPLKTPSTSLMDVKAPPGSSVHSGFSLRRKFPSAPRERAM